MSEVIQEIGTPVMVEAMAANFAEEMMCFGRVLPGGIVQEGPELWMFYTGRPYLNGVTMTQLAHSDTAYIDEKITQMLDFFSRRNMSTHWSVSPATHPVDLATHLQARGFAQVGMDMNMAIDVQIAKLSIRSHSELVIKEITDLETLNTQRDISKIGFDSTTEGAQTYYESYAANGFGEGKPWHHYIALLSNTPVGIASLLLHAGIAGIYGVVTLPETRKQGVGTALTLHAMQEARALGYRIAILSPSHMGLHMYRTIGFQEVGMTYHYLKIQE